MSASTQLSSNAVSQRIFRKRPEDSLPLSVEHQRIYIVPSKRGFAFLLALLICLIASINYQLNLGYGLSFLLAGLFAASLLHTYKNLAGITLDALQATSVVCGDTATFNLRLLNRSQQDRIGININYAGQSVSIDLSAEDSSTAELPLPTTHRGYQPIGRLSLTSQYPIGLWTTWSYCHTPAAVVVYPKPETNPPLVPRSVSDGDSDSIKNGVEGDVASLRDYVPGDPLTRIAWKRAARGGSLQVRELEENNPGGDIELSLAATELIETEAQISRLAAWVNDAHRSGTAYSLTLGNTFIETSSGDSHRSACMDALAHYKTSPNTNDSINTRGVQS